MFFSKYDEFIETACKCEEILEVMEMRVKMNVENFHSHGNTRWKITSTDVAAEICLSLIPTCCDILHMVLTKHKRSPRQSTTKRFVAF